MQKIALLLSILLGAMFAPASGKTADRLFFEQLEVAANAPHTPIYGICKDRQGLMWFGTWDGLYRYDGIHFKVYRKSGEASEGISSNRIRTVFNDRNGTLWCLGFDHSLARYVPEQDCFVRVNPADRDYAAIGSLGRQALKSGRSARHEGVQWTLKDDRLWQLDPGGQSPFFYQADLNRPGSLSDDFVSWIYLDDQQILWAGMKNGEINKADLRRKPFHFHYNRTVENGVLKNSSVRALFDDGRQLWLASDFGGISLVDHRTGLTTSFDQLVRGAPAPDRVRTITADTGGTIWMGNHDGVFRYQAATRTLKAYRAEAFSNRPPVGSVFSIDCSSDGTVWVGMYNGFARYIPQEDRFYYVALPNEIHGHSVMKMMTDRHGNLWLGTEGDGLVCLKKGEAPGSWSDTIVFRHYAQQANALPGNLVYSLFEDRDGLIWVGSSTGICYIDPSSGTVHRLAPGSGIDRGYISFVSGDNAGNIWIAHKNGLTRYEKASGRVRHFSSVYGNQKLSFLDNSGFRDPRTGTLSLGTKEGFLQFKPNEIADNPQAPTVVFTGLEVQNIPVEINRPIGGKPILTRALPYTRSIGLSYWERSFTFSFSALHYAEPADNRYAFKLEGYDDQWIYTDARHATAAYPNLPAGSYCLRVKAANPDGIWSENDARMHIVIRPPFWAGPLAYLVYLALAAGLLVWVYVYLIARVKFRNQLAMERLGKEKAIEIDRLKLEFYTNVSHELRTPLSLIIDPVEQLRDHDLPPEKQQDYFRIIHRNANRLLRLINQLLDFRKIETGNETLNPVRTDWVAFSRSLTESFLLHARQRNIGLRFQSSVDCFVGWLDEDKVEKILVNLLSNAIKYTPDGGEVLVGLEGLKPSDGDGPLSGKLVLSVRDSGIGIAPGAMARLFDPFIRVPGNKAFEGNSSGIGLALTRKLVELMNGRIWVESHGQQGSRFVVELPVPASSAAQLADDSPPEHAARAVHLPEKEAKAKPLLLLVDDHTDILHYLETEMQAEYTICTATNGKEARQKATELVPDLIISDVMMPDTDGLELCRKLKADVRTSHIPVILLTARQSINFKIEGLEKGADAYITKPFSTPVLKAQAKSLTDNRRKLQQYYRENPGSVNPELAANDPEQEFLQRAIGLVEANLGTAGFNTGALAEKLNLSPRQLYRKLNALTGQPVHRFISSIRLNRAKVNLLKKDKSISEVAFELGYTELSNFSRSFSKQFGKSPSQFVADN